MLIEEVAVRMPRLQSALNTLRQISERMTAVAVQRAKVQSVAGEKHQLEKLRLQDRAPYAAGLEGLDLRIGDVPCAVPFANQQTTVWQWGRTCPVASRQELSTEAIRPLAIRRAA